MSSKTGLAPPPDMLEEAKIDRDRMAARYFCQSKFMLLCPGAIPHLWICQPCACTYVWCCAEQNARELADAEHLFLTSKRLVHIVEARNSGFRCKCFFKGKVEKTIPLERITDLAIADPGRGCIDDRYGVKRLEVSTAGSHGPELVLMGLADADAFKARVLAAKERLEAGGAGAAGQEGLGHPADTNAVVAALQRIEDLLRPQFEYHKIQQTMR